MSLLKPLTDQAGYLKAGFLGKNKSGKTYTAAKVAIGVHKQFKSKKPIAFWDSEGGSAYVRDMIETETGMELIGMRSRSLNDLAGTLRECEGGASDVLLVDSITHPWRECMESYLKQKGTSRMSFPDWAAVKGMWNDRWTDPYLNARIHIILCGRAGDQYEMTEDPETGKKEVQVTGVKMKTETEFGFEPSLLIEMQRDQAIVDGKRVVRHHATIIGDRFHIIDGQTMNNPTYDFFKPHIDLLVPGSHAPVDVDLKTQFELDGDGHTARMAIKKAKTILLEEIVGALTAQWPSTGGADKKAKGDMLNDAFQTRSWTAIESLGEANLAEGLAYIENKIGTLNEEPATKK